MKTVRVVSVLVLILIATVKSDHEGSSDPLDWLRDAIPGEPGVDYPILSGIADTSFSCADRIFGGYYADPEMQCQGYHVCLTPPNAPIDRKTSFLCPNGTIFSQALLTCDWWFNVDCSETEGLYSINEKLGSEEPIATDEASLSSSNSLENQRQNQLGVGSASVLAGNEPRSNEAAIELVQYDATIPQDDDDYYDDVPIILADPFRDITDEEEEQAPLSLYGAPPP